MRGLVLAATVLLRNCCSGETHRIHDGEYSTIYRLLGHPAIGPLSNLAGQIELIDAAIPCLLSAAGDDQDILDSVLALRKRSTLLKPVIKHVRDLQKLGNFSAFIHMHRHR